jgi:Rrf2 family protein
MFDLAMHSGEGAIALKSVAEREHISEKYLEHLFASLKKAGLIHSVRGAQGGYCLAHLPSEITIGDIVRVLEGPVSPTECVVDEVGSERCDRASDCVMRAIWSKVKTRIDEVLDSVTLAEICEEERKKKQHGYMYYI